MSSVQDRKTMESGEASTVKTQESGDSDPVTQLLKAKIAQLENDGNQSAKVNKAHLKELRQALQKILTENDSTEEQLKGLSNKYFQLFHDNQNLTVERDQLQLQISKVNKMKGKLEVLCRELQKQNKTIMEDSKRTAEDEQQKRQELSKKFHDTITQVTTKMEEQGEERIRLFRENELLKEKLKSFAEQYQIREKHFETQAKAKDLELQLMEAKLKQQNEIATQESLRAHAYNEQIKTLTVREKELSTQLAYYAEKFEQFQDTLTKSNDIFTTFKQEMEKMSKTLKKSEKDNADLRKKCEQTDVALIELAEERSNYKKQLDATTNQKKKLEELCRVLQTERVQLRQQIQQLKNPLESTPTSTTNSVESTEIPGTTEPVSESKSTK